MQSATKLLGLGSVLLAFATAEGCGSNGGSAEGADAGANGGTISNPDQVPPQVVFRTPGDGEEQVSMRTPIRAVFSEPVKFGATPTTLWADGVAIPTTLSLSDDATILTISTGSEIPLPAKLSVNLGDITDLQGNPLVRPPWSWTAPLWLMTDPIDNDGGFRLPVIAGGPAERINVALGQADTGSGTPISMQAVERPGGPPWTPVAASVASGQTNQPQLLVDKEGALVIAYFATDGLLHVKRFTAGTWRNLDASLHVEAFYNVALKMDSEGIFFLAYDTGTATDSNVVVQTLSRDDAHWRLLGTTVNDASTEKGVRLQSLTLDKNGTPYVAYGTEANVGSVRAWSKNAWTLVGGPLNGPDEQVGVESIQITTDDASRLFALVSFSNLYLSRYRTQILRFDGVNWTNYGPELAHVSVSIPFFLAPTRSGHLFAYLGFEDQLHMFDLTDTGWVTIPSPAVLPSPGSRLAGGAGSIDPEGVPVIGWSDDDGIKVARLNR